MAGQKQKEEEKVGRGAMRLVLGLKNEWYGHHYILGARNESPSGPQAKHTEICEEKFKK